MENLDDGLRVLAGVEMAQQHLAGVIRRWVTDMCKAEEPLTSPCYVSASMHATWHVVALGKQDHPCRPPRGYIDP